MILVMTLFYDDWDYYNYDDSGHGCDDYVHVYGERQKFMCLAYAAYRTQE